MIHSCFLAPQKLILGCGAMISCQGHSCMGICITRDWLGTPLGYVFCCFNLIYCTIVIKEDCMNLAEHAMKFNPMPSSKQTKKNPSAFKQKTSSVLWFLSLSNHNKY